MFTIRWIYHENPFFTYGLLYAYLNLTVLYAYVLWDIETHHRTRNSQICFVLEMCIHSMDWWQHSCIDLCCGALCSSHLSLPLSFPLPILSPFLPSSLPFFCCSFPYPSLTFHISRSFSIIRTSILCYAENLAPSHEAVFEIHSLVG